MKSLKTFLLTKSVGSYINLMSYWNTEKAFRLAYRLFSQPRAGRLNQLKLPTILESAKHETLSIDEHQVQTYHWQGSKTVVLLLHGWESNSARWEQLLPDLQHAGYTIIAIDAPGHGLTSGKEFNVPLYAVFTEAAIQKYKPQHIIGHSMGGITAAYYQHIYRNNPLQKMVLLGAPSDFDIILENYIKLLGLNHKIKAAFHDYTRKRFQIEIAEFSGKEFLKSSTLKGLIVHDNEDDVVKILEAQKLASGWKSAALVTTSGLGHGLRDEAINKKIVDFLLGA